VFHVKEILVLFRMEESGTVQSLQDDGVHFRVPGMLSIWVFLTPLPLATRTTCVSFFSLYIPPGKDILKLPSIPYFSPIFFVFLKAVLS
jgi:hypothetical protein